MSNPLAPVADWFLLRQAERRAAEVPSERLQLIRKLSLAGSRRLNAAIDLRETAPEVGLILLREASPLLIAAYAVARGHDVDPGSGVAAAWRELDKTGPKDAPEQLGAVAETLSAADPLAFDVMSRDDVLAKFTAAETVLTWLYHQIDARSPKEIRFARIVRIAIVATLAVASLVWAGMSLFSAPNVALHKPTASSSLWPGSGTDGLTNGVNENGYAVATNYEPDPWIRVDLQDVYRISSIVVVPRGDGHADELVPAAVEISETGSDWSEVGRRSETYSQLLPWKVSVSGKRARYVRVRGLRQTVIALAEIEVRGRR
jgi:hypothetical protein